jgi:hypothetical protein
MPETDDEHATIGVSLASADDSRKTEVRYDGTVFHINQCWWSARNEWTVTLRLVPQYPTIPITELYRHYLYILSAIKILSALNYEFDYVDDGCAVWSKCMSNNEP